MWIIEKITPDFIPKFKLQNEIQKIQTRISVTSMIYIGSYDYKLISVTFEVMQFRKNCHNLKVKNCPMFSFNFIRKFGVGVHLAHRWIYSSRFNYYDSIPFSLTTVEMAYLLFLPGSCFGEGINFQR